MTGQPEILNLAFKEIAQKAWNAAMEQVEQFINKVNKWLKPLKSGYLTEKFRSRLFLLRHSQMMIILILLNGKLLSIIEGI